MTLKEIEDGLNAGKTFKYTNFRHREEECSHKLIDGVLWGKPADSMEFRPLNFSLSQEVIDLINDHGLNPHFVD